MSALTPILKQCLLHPTRTAVVDDQRTYRFIDLAMGGMYVAREIESATSRKHVGILLPTSGGFVVSLLGTWLADRVAVPLNFLLKKEELAYVIADSEIDTIITAKPMLDFLGGRENLPDDINLLLLDEVSFKGIPPLRWPPRADPNDLAVLLYTSGTSGKPKGVMLSHRNLRTNAFDSLEHAKIRSDDRFLGVLPQFHTFGLTALTLIPLYKGCSVIYSARFVPKNIVERIAKYSPTVFIAIPSMYGALATVKSATKEDMSSIRIAISGGEPLPNAVFELMQEKFGIKVLEGYGLTETAPVTNWSTLDNNRLHSVGTSLPRVTEVIVDEEDRLLPANTDGEILITGPNVMQGYFKLPAETKKAFVNLDVPGMGKTRFFRTGDIGHLDDQGFLYITGRKKEMIIVGGENVFPREIEEILNAHPGVHASAVIGKADGMRGEVPVAFVEMEEDATFDEAALRAACREKLAGYKVPREIRRVDQLPRNPTGKILRRELQPD